jgi:hypothetical protein
MVQSENETKMDKATKVFLAMYGKEDVRRKDIINVFINRCNLTPAGASTYYQNIKKKQTSA